MRKKNWVIAGSAVVLLAGSLVVARATTRTKPDTQESPFRLGKVQSEDLQVSVREVGVVDPEIKVDVKSAVSGRVMGLKVREGDVVRTGQVMAEVEPDVNQAQSLSDVKSGVAQADL
jgi:HlyD family secretion protein